MDNLTQAVLLLQNTVRDELKDHAFGDREVFWMKSGIEVASGYFSGDTREVFIQIDGIQVTFTGDEAVTLSVLGQPSVTAVSSVGRGTLSNCQ
jgi:hypothetical protein